MEEWNKMFGTALSAAIRLYPGKYRAHRCLPQSRAGHVVHPEIVLSKNEAGSTNNLRRNTAVRGVYARQAWRLHVFGFSG